MTLRGVQRVRAALGALLLAAACGGAERAAGPQPRRIVAVAPSVVEILFALGLGERVVGVGEYARWPPAVEGLPRIGGLYDARLETIVALEPDLAVLIASERDLRDRLRGLGIEVLVVESETLADVEEAIGIIAARAGAVDAGRRLIEEWRRELAPRRLPGAPRVALTLTRPAGRLGDVLVAGPGTFLDELLRRLGAENAFADAPLLYPQVGAEEFLRRQPRVIVELQPEELPAGRAAALIDDWQALPELEAVASGCVRVVAGDHVLLPGPRVGRLYRELEEAIRSCGESG